MDIVEKGTGGIGVIGNVHVSSGEFPYQKAIYGAKEQIAFFGPLSGTFHMIQYPLDLGGRKIGINEQSGFLPDQIFFSGCF